MFYYIGDWLQSLDFSLARLLTYVSFRAVMSFVFALFIATLFGKRVIRFMQKRQIGESIRDLGLEGELSKKNTPTMGGFIIIIAILFPVLLWANVGNIYIILMLFTTVMMTLLGFLDDFIKVFRKKKEGLAPKYKLIIQSILGIIIGTTLYLSPEVVIRENIGVEIAQQEQQEPLLQENVRKSTKTTIPFFKAKNFEYKSLIPFPEPYKEVGGWILFILITTLIITTMSNCVNLTDGLDGLATGTSAPVGVVLLFFAYVSSHVHIANYLNIMYIPGTEELVIFAAAFIGATIGFLWYNSYPAQIFMGDTGSLTLGGIIAVFTILIRKELLLPVFCGVFIVEGFSSIFQMLYFKYTRKRYGSPKRIIRMAPLHHHFQKGVNDIDNVLLRYPKKKIAENKIVVRFWLISLILAAITLLTLKIR